MLYLMRCLIERGSFICKDVNCWIPAQNIQACLQNQFLIKCIRLHQLCMASNEIEPHAGCISAIRNCIVTMLTTALVKLLFIFFFNTVKYNILSWIQPGYVVLEIFIAALSPLSLKILNWINFFLIPAEQHSDDIQVEGYQREDFVEPPGSSLSWISACSVKTSINFYTVMMTLSSGGKCPERISALWYLQKLQHAESYFLMITHLL